MEGRDSLGRFVKGGTSPRKGERGKNIAWNKGKKHSPASIEKMRQSHIGKKFVREHPMRTTSTCRVCGVEFNHYGDVSGKYCSRECMNKCPELRDIRRQKLLENPLRYWLGKKRPDMWTDENGPADNSKYRSPAWHKVKKEVYKRDNYICQECGKKTTGVRGKDGIACHHIDYNFYNMEQSNLITLCSSCHPRTNASRDGWTKYFNKKITERKL